MKKLDNLLKKDIHIVERRKIIFAIPIAIFFIAALLMIIFRFTIGSALNLGTDFTGGYSIDVQLGDKLTKDNYNKYCSQIESIMSSVTSESGKTYSIRVDNMQSQGEGSKASIHVKYFAVKGASESEMLDDVNPAIKTALENEVLNIIPSVSVAGKNIIVTYPEIVEHSVNSVDKQFGNIIEKLNADFGAGINDYEVALSDKKTTVVISCDTLNNGVSMIDFLTDELKLNDKYAGKVTQGDMVGATVSKELLFNAVLAVCLALVFMLCYIAIRFQLSSGLACIIALFHDILIMFSFMAICRIPINSTFIAALITILGYSINNSIIIFDRVRENMRSIYAKSLSAEDIANKSIRETLLRSINTTITTLIMIGMVAIIGVKDIRIFAFPIIIGLLSGTFSSICIAPSFWVIFQHVGKKNKNNSKSLPKSNKEDKSTSKASA